MTPEERYRRDLEAVEARYRKAIERVEARRAKRDALLALHRQGKTFEEIGRAFGVTRQAIHFALRGLESRPACPKCSRPTTVLNIARRGVCRKCRRTSILVECRRCGRTFERPPRKYAQVCPQCRTETRSCSNCGRPITRDLLVPDGPGRNRQWFCDRRCHGAWLGRRNGRLTLSMLEGEGEATSAAVLGLDKGQMTG